MAKTYHHVTRLVVLFLGEELGTVEEAMSCFSSLASSNQLSNSRTVLEVQSEILHLRDQHNRVLEEFQLPSLLRCDSVISETRFSSLLLLVVQSSAHKHPSVHFFNCAPVRAELIRDEIRHVVSNYTPRPKSFSQRQTSSMNGRDIPNPPAPQAPLCLPPISQNPLCLPPNTPPIFDIRANALHNGPDQAFLKAQQEVDLLNHCFEDVEAFMGKLQQAAEAQSILEQRNKKKKRSRKKSPEDDLLSAKAKPPPESEFIQIFQKFKYCFSLLARLKAAISNPSSEELVHHLYKPLDMIVKATGGPTLAASVSCPALTAGAVDLLQNTLTLQEHTLWSSLGPYWTQPRSALRGPVVPYSPVFLDGWRLPASEVEDWVDPVEAQHSRDADRSKQQSAVPSAVQNSDEIDGGVTPKERQYRCSYDFVARNSSELSVLQGESLEVIESSKRWWKCRNRFNEVGFVPFNILEPVSHIESPPKAPAPPPLMKTTSMAPPSPHAVTSHLSPQRPRSIALPPQHLPEDTEKVMQVNDELLQRLTNGKAAFSRSLVIPRSVDTSVPLDYQSPPAEVEAWLRGKGFSEPTVQCLRVLTGAQLFSLNKEELRAVIPEEGARVFSQLTVQKSLLEDVRKATELEAVMEKQKMKVDLKAESGTL